MTSPLTKRRLREALQYTSDAEVAVFFGITPSAVSQWREDDPIPELRQLQAERKRPDLFGAHGGEGVATETASVLSVDRAA